ncbi:MAG: AAA family ATPase [Actinobacteria bacterium]|nr:AAA family ATPase [Actinomycetota bacterium]MBU1942919.1 AAA family ATPase [Actinomycetota bacterium]MBU2687650.1 AAA family ATPase [Actinomycetota bacterium]
MTDNKIPPHNIEAEESVLGAMMISPAAAGEALEVLVPEDFYREAHRTLFRVISDVLALGKPTDPVVVAEELKRRGLLEAVGDRAYVYALIGTTPNPRSVRHYSDIVKDASRRRTIVDNAYLLADAAQTGKDYGPVLETITASGNDSIRTSGFWAHEPPDLPPVFFVVDDLLPAGLTLFTGREKSGKSFMLMSVALAITTGARAMETFRVDEPGAVLYLSLEDSTRRAVERLKMLADEPFPDNLRIETSWPRLDEGGAAMVESFVKQHAPRLVIVDVLQAVRPAAKSRNVYQEDYRALESLKRIADAGTAVLVAHHQRKAASLADDHLDLSSGSTGLTGAVDTVWTLKKIRGEADAVLHVVGRDVADAEWALRFEGGFWSALGPADEYRGGSERRAILQVIAAADEPLRPSDVAAALNKNLNTVNVTMRRMVNAGQLFQPHYGVYAVGEDGDDD